MANHSGDNETYEYYYNAVDYKSYDYIWGFLMNCGNFIGLNFYQFKAVIIMIAIFLIFYALKDETTNLYYVVLMYTISFVFIDSQVLRNFLSMSILLFSIRYLENIEYKRNILKYLICIIIATGIHKAFIIYAVLLIMMKFKNKQSLKKIIGIVGIFLLVITFINGKIPFLDSLLKYIDLGEKSSVFTTKTKFGAIPVILLHLYMILIIKALCSRIKNRYTDKQLEFYELVYFIDICMISLLPLVLINLNFYRLLKNIVLLNYAVLANAYINYKNRDSKIIIFSATLCLAIGWLIFETCIFGNIQDVVLTVLEP